MPFQLRWTPKSLRQLRELPKTTQVKLIDDAGRQLVHQPNEVTKHRKRLRENPLATWELRVGNYRVFYNVLLSENEVEVVAWGGKDHNELIIECEELDL